MEDGKFLRMGLTRCIGSSSFRIDVDSELYSQHGLSI